MTQQFSPFTEMRSRRSANGAPRSGLPNISRETVTGIFTYVLSQQIPSREWTIDDTLWMSS